MLPRFVVRSLVLLVLVCAAPSRADEFLDRANGLYRTIQQGKRSDLVLLPLIARMDAPPASAADPGTAMLLPAGSSGWTAAETWAMAAPQRAVVEALVRITKEEDPVNAMAFAQPYGADAVAAGPGGIDLIKANLYTDLGDPPMLAGARFLYLPGLDRVASLVNVEATRLAAADKPADAIAILIDWLFFCRQMADREMFAEARWGLRGMIATLDRVRDVAYTDLRSGKRALTPESVAPIQARLRAQRGYIRLDRLSFPAANGIAAEQVVAMVFQKSGQPNANFGQTMAHLASTQRPLRLFAEAARWDKIAADHADASDSLDELKKVYGDLSARWEWDPWDPRMAVTTDYEAMDRAKFGVLVAVLPDMTILFNDRQVLRTQMVGTRTAAAILAFAADSRNFPPTLAALRPRYVQALESDPFNPDRGQGRQPPLEYFVPGRDSAAAADPYEINVFTGGEQNFQVKVGSDQFVLYSVGPNNIKEYAQSVFGDPGKEAIGDVLLWPPVTSLVRQRLIEMGGLQ